MSVKPFCKNGNSFPGMPRVNTKWIFLAHDDDDDDDVSLLQCLAVHSTKLYIVAA